MNAMRAITTSFSFIRKDATDCNVDATFQRYDEDDSDKQQDKYSIDDEMGDGISLTILINPNPDRPNLTYEFIGVTPRLGWWTREPNGRT